MPVTSVRRPRAPRPNPRASGEEYSRFLLRYTSAPSPETRARLELRRVRRELREFIRTQTPRMVLVAAIGFGIGWILNFQFMRKKYDGFNVPEFAPFTGKGSRIVGMLFWLVLSAVVFAFIGMLRKRGRTSVKDQIVGVPARVRALVEQDKKDALRHLLWGFAGAMLVMLVLGPALTGLVSASFLLFMGTAFRRLLTGVLMVVWRWVVSLVAPERAQPPDPPAATVGAFGGMLAMLAGWWVVSGSGGRLVLAVAAAVGAVVLGQKQVAARMALLLLGGMTMAMLWLGGDTAFADDGGEAECSGRIRGCEGVGTLALLAGLGGAAAAIGAIVGTAVGEAMGEDDEDDGYWPEEDDDGVPCGDEGEAEASEWEKWSLAHPKGSWDEFMAERIERSRQAALAKGRDLDALQAEVDRLDAELERLHKNLKTAFEPTKPWNQMTNQEKAVAKAHLTRTWRQANPGADPTEFMAYMSRLDADPNLSTADMFQYIVGETVLGLPGATWDAAKNTFTTVGGAVMGSKEFAGNVFNNWLEDAASGEQADRLGRTFIDPIGDFWDNFHDRGPQAMLADMKASGVKVTQSGAKAFDGAMQQLHLAMVTGDAPAIAKVLDGAAGSLISDYLLTLGTGSVLSLTKKGVTAMRAGKVGLADDMVKGADEVLQGDSIPLDTEAKRRAVGHSENASQGFQDAVDKSGNKLQMQRRGEDAVDHEGKAYMKPQGGKYAKSVNPLDKHIGGPDEEGLLAFYEPINPLAAPGSPLQKRYETVKTLFDSVPGGNLAEKQAYLTKHRLEVWVNGEKVKIPVSFDAKGVMRHTQTGRPITSDYDGWAVLDANGRRLGYDDAGKRLTGAAKQADRQQKIPMIRDLVNDPRTNLQHAPTSSEWGPIPAILAGEDEKACSTFSCAIKKIGDNIVDSARKDGVVEYRPGEKHPYLTKAAGVKDAQAPKLKVKAKARPKTTAEKVASSVKGSHGTATKGAAAGAAANAAGGGSSAKPAKPAKAPKK